MWSKPWLASSQPGPARFSTFALRAGVGSTHLLDGGLELGYLGRYGLQCRVDNDMGRFRVI